MQSSELLYKINEQQPFTDHVLENPEVYLQPSWVSHQVLKHGSLENTHIQMLI